MQTYYRWRKESGGLKLDQAKQMKELERENAKLKRLVAELSDEGGSLYIGHQGPRQTKSPSLCVLNHPVVEQSQGLALWVDP